MESDVKLTHPSPVRTYNARQGRITALTSGTIERLWQRFGVDIDDDAALDLTAVFGPDVPVVLEIGCGMGTATAVMAADRPDIGILAVDVHTRGVSRLLQRVEDQGLDNVRVARGDAVRLLSGRFGPGSLAGIRIYFPDPWPKARHLKRRLVQPAFASLAATRLRPGGLLHCATDWQPYAEQMLAVLDAEPALANVGEGFVERPSWRPVTPFEQQGLAAGRRVHDLLHVRVGLTGSNGA